MMRLLRRLRRSPDLLPESPADYGWGSLAERREAVERVRVAQDEVRERIALRRLHDELAALAPQRRRPGTTRDDPAPSHPCPTPDPRERDTVDWSDRPDEALVRDLVAAEGTVPGIGAIRKRYGIGETKARRVQDAARSSRDGPGHS
ncbi:hypothetical protein [Actinomycetospora aeridis]|uniref:Ribosomal L7/L12-like protein n=1 Tax=Actinomycetospora aeridis TaxID=3129231 RepID=A0ABU8N2E5_9PSEU